MLLDIAHIDSYEHLERIIAIKFPKCIHLADKHFSAVHEHLPIGQGELDFDRILYRYLKGYDGKIIFEVTTDDDEAIVKGYKHIKQIVDKSRKY
jgi:sugar phosphate isomerase/epimerase